MSEHTSHITMSAAFREATSRSAVPCYQRTQLARRLWGERSAAEGAVEALRAALSTASPQVAD